MTLPKTTPGQTNEELSGRVVNDEGPREGYLPGHRDIRKGPGDAAHPGPPIRPESFPPGHRAPPVKSGSSGRNLKLRGCVDSKPLYSRASTYMSVLERFASPLRSRDAAVRLKAVQKHPPEDTEALAELARSDPDARVRKEAVRRIEAPRVLLELTDSASDDATRRLARSRGDSLLVKIAVDDRDLGESQRALGLLAPPRAVADVACRARFEAVRSGALARLTAVPADDPERDAALATVAGKATDPALRSQALEAISSPAGLLQVAVSAEDRESAQAAVRRLEDPELLLAAANNASSKGVRRLARRRADERLPPDHPERMRSREKALDGLLERLAEADPANPGQNESLLAEADTVVASGPVAPEFIARLAALRRTVQGASARDQRAARLLIPEQAILPESRQSVPAEDTEPPPDLSPEIEGILTRLEDPGDGLSLGEVDAAERECRRLLEGIAYADAVHTRLRTAVDGARERALHRKKTRVRDFQLAELADHAALLAKSLENSPSGPQLAQARRELTRLVRRFERLEPPETPDAERFRTAARDAETALSSAEASRKDHLRKSEERIAALEERLGALESAEPFPLEEGEAVLRELGGLRSNASLWRQAGPERQARFQRSQAALIPPLREAREIREWRRWSNLEEQSVLIRRARALLENEDLQRVDRELALLERAWHKARHTGRDRGQELWEEWGKVRGTLLERVGPLREAAERELAQQLEGLRALAEKAEEIADGNDPRQAAEMRSLMPAWRERARGIGKRSERLWKRFRAANDRYFAELKVVMKKRYEEFAANIPIREELIGRARALLDQKDAGAVRDAVRDLMREWKESPPVPRKESERLWDDFRSACDQARDRLREPAGDARSEVGGAREDAPRSEAEAELRNRIAELATRPMEERQGAATALWDDYRRIARSTDRLARETENTLLGVLRETFEANPEIFAGTRLDQEQLASRLVGLLEEIESLAAPSASVPSDAGVIGIAEHLQRTLQAGRAADRGAVLREDAGAATKILERARAAGPALADPTVETVKRIEGLARKVIARAPSAEEQPRDRGHRGRARPRGRRPPRP